MAVVNWIVFIVVDIGRGGREEGIESFLQGKDEGSV